MSCWVGLNLFPYSPPPFYHMHRIWASSRMAVFVCRPTFTKTRSSFGPRYSRTHNNTVVINICSTLQMKDVLLKYWTNILFETGCFESARLWSSISNLIFNQEAALFKQQWQKDTVVNFAAYINCAIFSLGNTLMKVISNI